MSARQMFFACLVTFGLACSLTWLLRGLAPRWGAVAAPKPDRWHRRPTALLGGVAIVLATVIGAALFVRPVAGYGGLAAAAVLIFAAGLWDDIHQLSPPTKLCIQVVAAVLVVSSGLVIHWTSFPLVRDAVTLFWLVGMTNAFNLLDNMDGLAAGIAVIGAGFLALAASLAVGPASAVASVAVVLPALLGSAALGFLIFNFQPASIFMGDCGSMFLGFSLGGLSLLGMASRARGFAPVLFAPVFLLMLPILDTTLVTVARMLSGRPVSQGGRDHTSHRLVSLGLSERAAVLLLYGFATLCGLAGLTFHWVPTPVLLFLLPTVLLAILAWGLMLGQVRVYPLHEVPPRGAFRLLVNFAYKRRVMEMALDLVIMVLAFYGAFLLRFDGFLPGPERTLFIGSLPLLIGIEVVVFWAAGMYRGLWHYLTVDDLLVITRACVLAALLAGGVVLLRHPQPRLSINVLIVNGMALLIMAVGSRMSFRILRSWIMRISTAHARSQPVLIYGAGVRGARLVRNLREFPNGLRPVAVLDDNPALFGQRLHGCRVLSVASAPSLTRRHGIRQVMISTAKIPDSRLEPLRRLNLDTVRVDLPW